MAAIQNRAGSFPVLFRYEGRQYTWTLGRVDQDEAMATAARVEYLLMRVRQRLLSVPVGTSGSLGM
jgi:hypothetical protein